MIGKPEDSDLEPSICTSVKQQWQNHDNSS